METLIIDPNAKKSEKYEALLPQIKSLIEGESNLVANLANISAALKEAFDFWWCGFYLVDGEQLVLGPFQGPIACTRIPYGRGVCGTAWKEARTIIVPDVEQFPGHIACSSLSRSEIVVPIFATPVIASEANQFPHCEQVKHLQNNPNNPVIASEANRLPLCEQVNDLQNNPDNPVLAVLDIDSAHLNTFDEVDRKYLEELCRGIVI